MVTPQMGVIRRCRLQEEYNIWTKEDKKENDEKNKDNVNLKDRLEFLKEGWSGAHTLAKGSLLRFST